MRERNEEKVTFTIFAVNVLRKIRVSCASLITSCERTHCTYRRYESCRAEAIHLCCCRIDGGAVPKHKLEYDPSCQVVRGKSTTSSKTDHIPAVFSKHSTYLYRRQSGLQRISQAQLRDPGFCIYSFISSLVSTMCSSPYSSKLAQIAAYLQIFLKTFIHCKNCKSIFLLIPYAHRIQTGNVTVIPAVVYRSQYLCIQHSSSSENACVHIWIKIKSGAMHLYRRS